MVLSKNYFTSQKQTSTIQDEAYKKCSTHVPVLSPILARVNSENEMR